MIFSKVSNEPDSMPFKQNFLNKNHENFEKILTQDLKLFTTAFWRNIILVCSAAMSVNLFDPKLFN